MAYKIKGKMLSPVKIEHDQWDWLQLEAGKRADTVASVLRSVLQEKVNKAKRKGEM